MKTKTKEKTNQTPPKEKERMSANHERVLSPTQITTYLSCPLKHYFRYVLKVEPEKKQSYFAFGSAIHSTLSYYWKQKKAGTILPVEELHKAFLLDWEIQNTVPVDYGEDDPKALEQMGKELLKVYVESVPTDGIPVAVEKSFKIPVVNTLTGDMLPHVSLYGKLDLILKGTVVEHKTGLRLMEQEKADEDIQMGCYAMAYLMLYNELPETLRFDVLLKQKKPRLESVSTYRSLKDLARLYHTVEQVNRGIENQIVYPCYSFQCKNCEYNTDEHCKSWGRNERTFEV